MSNWRALYPFESRFATVDGRRYHYVDEGAGEPLLFVHGNPTWSFYWHPLILPLRESHRSIAIDHIGCGLSDKPVDYPYCLAQHIDNLVEFIERLNLSGVTLAAHDWGGAIGLGAALRAPQRFARFILFNTGAFPPPFIPLRIRACRAPLVGRWAVQGPNVFARAALSMATEKPERMTPGVRAGLLAPYDSWAHRTAVYRFVKDIPASPRHPTWQVLEEIERGLGSLADRPVQFFWGMRDWCFRPTCLERLQQHFPHAALEKFEDAGHYVVLDAHERIVPRMKAFLSTPLAAMSVAR
jgi:haloalkane dehalogenase